MSLRDLNLKKSYDSDQDDILNDFYVPALSASVDYRRLAGFFSSTSLAIAARGIAGLISNGGKIKLICGAKLRKEDIEAVLEVKEDLSSIIAKNTICELDEITNLEDKFIENHVRALGWMVRQGLLSIKVALVKDDENRFLDYQEVLKLGLFHQKVGILQDTEENIVSFSGSDNETAAAWTQNIEEFKVFCSWEESQREYLEADIRKFDTFWFGLSKRTAVLDIPEAVKKKFIEIAPDDIEELELKSQYVRKQRKKIQLWNHQVEAVKAWINNEMKGIFEMATGTGKTLAALGCVEKVFNIADKLLLIISCPYQHLGQQWEKEISKFGISCDEIIIADSSNPGWKNKFADLLTEVSLNYKSKLGIITTHRSLQALERIIEKEKKDLTIIFIADEVHGLGAKQAQKGLSDFYNFRLGLSATPKRYFDLYGTDKIYAYFNGVVYGFPIEKAINTINPATGETYLTPYRYLVKFVSLTGEELDLYAERTRTIVQKYHKAETETEANNLLSILLFERSKIVKNAVSKYEAIVEILKEIRSEIHGTLVYCSPQQIDIVMKLMREKRLIARRFTMAEGVTPSEEYDGFSEREYILRKFSEGKYEVLVAMKCLDEGIDIPSAKATILMASSGNPREFIQRIGRVIRRYPGKREAKIYDIIVVPTEENCPEELLKLEKKIFTKELERYEEIAKNALNEAEVLNEIDLVKAKIWG